MNDPMIVLREFGLEEEYKNKIGNNNPTNIKKYELLTLMVRFLEQYQPQILYELVDQAIEKKAYMDGEKSFEEYMLRYAKLEKQFSKKVNIELPETVGKVEEMEKNCQLVTYFINNEKPDYKDRYYLFLIYSKYGIIGHERFEQIMQTKENYKHNMSDFNSLKKKKSNGVSCETLIKKGICIFNECEIYAKISTK